MPRAKLNNLSAKEWVKRTKSVWSNQEVLREFQDVSKAIKYGVLLSKPKARDKLKLLHPATFAEEDIQKLIEFFTKEGEVVLDPFIGSGSTAIACMNTGRTCIGIELYPEWIEVTKKRLGIFAEKFNIIQGNVTEVIKTIPSESIDFIVTSPPYWGILSKVDHKTKKERLSKKLAKDYGNNPDDLSLIQSYEEFLNKLGDIFKEFYRVLKPKRYACIIVSDFRHRNKYYMFHADIGKILEKAGFILHGLINLIQDNKNLYPYGYPYTFVPNICNQFVLVAYKHEL